MGWSTILRDMDGNQIDDGIGMQANGYFAALGAATSEAEKAKANGLKLALTLGAACRQALTQELPDDRDASPEQKFANGMLAWEIKNGTAVLDSTQITLVRNRIAKLFLGAEVTFATWPLLDPAYAKKLEPKEPAAVLARTDAA